MFQRKGNVELMSGEEDDKCRQREYFYGLQNIREDREAWLCVWREEVQNERIREGHNNSQEGVLQVLKKMKSLQSVERDGIDDDFP